MSESQDQTTAEISDQSDYAARAEGIRSDSRRLFNAIVETIRAEAEREPQPSPTEILLPALKLMETALLNLNELAEAVNVIAAVQVHTTTAVAVDATEEKINQGRSFIGKRVDAEP